MLTKDQWKELERWGATKVRAHLANFQDEPAAIITGFKTGNIMRSDIERWLAEKHFVAILRILKS